MQPNTAQVASPRGPPVYVQATCVPCRRRGRLRSQDRSRRCRPWWGWRPPTRRRPFELSRSRRLRTGSVYVATLHLRRAAAGNWTRGRRGTKLLRSGPPVLLNCSSTAAQRHTWRCVAHASARTGFTAHPPPRCGSGEVRRSWRSSMPTSTTASHRDPAIQVERPLSYGALSRSSPSLRLSNGPFTSYVARRLCITQTNTSPPIGLGDAPPAGANACRCTNCGKLHVNAHYDKVLGCYNGGDSALWPSVCL